MGIETKVELDNIGIIHDSEIHLHGLTIVTGHNNSGKTTVGKTLFALLSSVNHLQEDADRDKIAFARSELSAIRNEIMQDRWSVNEKAIYFNFKHFIETERNQKKTETDILANYLQEGEYPRFESATQLVYYINELREQVGNTSTIELSDLILGEGSAIEESRKINLIKKKRIQLLDALEALLDKLFVTGDLLRYTNKKIEKGLRKEFNNQILPVKANNVVGDIKVWMQENDSPCFHVEIEQNFLKEGKQAYFKSPYKDVVFIDNAFVIDSMSEYREQIRWQLLRNHSSDAVGSWTDNADYKNHNKDLLDKLTQKAPNIYEEIVKEEEARVVFDKISQVFPEEISASEDGYFCSQSRLDIRNLATGSKLFAMIKVLMEKGEITSGTLLILDEPESHLHPQWQNEFAEMIVLLIKFLGVHILLTTHSPNFLLALEVYAKKHNMWDDTNVYCTELMEDRYMVQYVDVKNQMKRAYGKLAEPLFDLQKLKEAARCREG